jgi:hypothetical protein
VDGGGSDVSYGHGRRDRRRVASCPRGAAEHGGPVVLPCIAVTCLVPARPLLARVPPCAPSSRTRAAYSTMSLFGDSPPPTPAAARQNKSSLFDDDEQPAARSTSANSGLFAETNTAAA